MDLGVSEQNKHVSEYAPVYIILGIVQVFLIMTVMLSYDIVQHIYIRIVIVKDTLLNQDRFQCVLYHKLLPCVLLFYDVQYVKMYNEKTIFH